MSGRVIRNIDFRRVLRQAKEVWLEARKMLLYRSHLMRRNLIMFYLRERDNMSPGQMARLLTIKIRLDRIQTKARRRKMK